MKTLRTMWKGVLRLDSCTIPVRLYAAAQDQTVHFRLLHRKDSTPVKQQLVAADDQREVPRDEMQKAAEVEPGVFVLLSDEELEAIKPESSRDIEVRQFVPRSALRHMWYDRPYYLAPDGENDLYWALVDALDGSDREAIARWVMRDKDYVGSLQAAEGLLVLVTLRFAEQVVQPREIPARFRSTWSAAEEDMADKLMAMLESDFDPSDYRDDYRDRVMDLIRAKARGEKVELPKGQPKKRPSSLADALKASLASADKKH